jgi:hypothetical protein
MGDELRITVIATGFERTGVPRRILEKSSNRVEAPATNIMEEAPISVSANRPIEFQPRTFNTDDLDIPTFLRNRTR